MNESRVSPLNIDLHYHAGAERPEGESAADFITWAAGIGVQILGVTDHWELYDGNPRGNTMRFYDSTLEGMQTLAHEVMSAASDYPDIVLFFGPEILLSDLKLPETERLFALPEVTYFLGEQNNWHPDETHGDHLINGLKNVARLRDTYSRPGILAHPLRKAIIDYAGRPVGFPVRPQHPHMQPLDSVKDPVRDVSELFDVDLPAFCKAARDYDVPVELNGGSWSRVTKMNDTSLEERFVFFFRYLLERGVKLTPGSDRHTRTGEDRNTEILQRVGICAQDVAFVGEWI